MQYYDSYNMNSQHVIIDEPSANLRKLGRTALAGHWISAIIAAFIFSLLTYDMMLFLDGAFGTTQVIDLGRDLGLGSNFYGDVITVTQSPISNLYTTLTTGVFHFGLLLFFLNMFRGTGHSYTDVFRGFESFIKVLALTLYMGLFIFLWAIIPLAGLATGPIAAIRYSQSYFIMMDHPDWSISACVNESKRLMYGNKGKFFALCMSFIGWALLALVPLIVSGILFYDLTANNLFFEILVDAIASIGVYALHAYLSASRVGFYEILTGKLKVSSPYIAGGQW